MNYFKVKPGLLRSLFFLTLATSAFSSGMDREEDRERNKKALTTVAGEHIRFSAQTSCSNVEKKLKFISVKLPNGSLVPLDLDEAKNGRIPVCDLYPFSSEEKIVLELVGHGDYKGCNEEIPLYIGASTKTTADVMPQMEAPKRIVTAIRITIEDKLPSEIKGISLPGFVRASAYIKCVKFKKKGQKTKQFDKKIIASYSELAPEGTYANDVEILNDIIENSAFVHHKEELRINEYMQSDFGFEKWHVKKEEGEEEEDEKDLNGNVRFVIGKYVQRANKKYGKLDDKEKRLLINFFVQNDLVSRLQVELAEDMLGM